MLSHNSEGQIHFYLDSYLRFVRALRGSALFLDPVRNHPRFEMLAAALAISPGASSISKLDNDGCTVWSGILRSHQRESGYWAECGYNPDDEVYGPDGLVTTAFAILGLIRDYDRSPSEDLLGCILKAGDVIYASENRGSFQKSQINKSDVINTNLLAALSLFEIAQRLKQNSARKRLYTELARRAIHRALGYQLPSGIFPYHHETLAQPYLYHAMVMAILLRFQSHFNSGVLELAIGRAQRALSKMFATDGSALWENANNHDKKGAVWFYSFALATRLGAYERAAVEKHLSTLHDGELFETSDFDSTPDFFYSSWAVWGLIWSQVIPAPAKIRGFDYLRSCAYRAKAAVTAYRFVMLYWRNLLRNTLFPSGALENRSWAKR